MEELSEVKPFKVVLGICAHRDLKAKLWKRLESLRDCPNPKIEINILDGDALISRSRSLVATQFYDETDADMLMFLDDDVVISAFDATKLMQEAWQLNLPVVGAAYVTKSKTKPGFAVRPLKEEELEFGTNGKLYEMRSISSGCMVIRREVLKEFIKSGIAPRCSHAGTFSYYPFFQHEKMIIDDAWEDMSEDWYFCEKARKLGFSIWCDTTIKTGHIGPYEYSWDDIIETRNGMRKTYEGGTFRVAPHDRPALQKKVA